ncbi:MAG: hypothetical protein K8R52_11310 [Bacteroidales bacterium]|nr:hypothetical protein [Bacteroidales bacterium]
MALNYKTVYPAFTLWELMIAMLITSLIVALSYGIYWKFTEVLNQEVEQAELMHELRLLERDLYRLTQSCKSIIREGDQLVFKLSGSYSYLEFSDSTLTIVNDEIFTDREYPSEYSAEYTREIPIEGWTSEYLDGQSEHVSSFQIKCRADLQMYTLTFNKIYPNLFLYSMTEL